MLHLESDLLERGVFSQTGYIQLIAMYFIIVVGLLHNGIWLMLTFPLSVNLVASHEAHVRRFEITIPARRAM